MLVMSNNSLVVCFYFCVKVKLIFFGPQSKVKKETVLIFFTLNMLISLVLVGFKSFINK